MAMPQPNQLDAEGTAKAQVNGSPHGSRRADYNAQVLSLRGKDFRATRGILEGRFSLITVVKTAKERRGAWRNPNWCCWCVRAVARGCRFLDRLRYGVAAALR